MHSVVIQAKMKFGPFNLVHPVYCPEQTIGHANGLATHFTKWKSNMWPPDAWLLHTMSDVHKWTAFIIRFTWYEAVEHAADEQPVYKLTKTKLILKN